MNQLSNWSLESFDNIYASLAQSAYTGRPIVFDYSSLKKDQQKALDSGQSVRFDFSQDVEKKGQITQGASGDGYPDKSDPKASKTELYLQPDQQGLLTDEKTGYQAYYVSDTAEINQDTHQTYFVVRGSDGFGIDTDKLAKDPLDYLANMNPSDFNYEDWINNDMAFALTDAIVPQAGEATKGMKAKIAELNARAASDAQMSITGHSLGTIVSIQGAAGLSHAELQKVDQIVLLQIEIKS
ncbi:triacylglycerol lipase [Streptococcus macacae]|uniref:triacylglycerol lipase n=1 Tax=Streptococcus macacae TaxID=1339 RepID=UPI0039908FD9